MGEWLEVCTASPSGNGTVFVLTQVAKERRATLAKALLLHPELPGMEQVGYVCAPKHGGGARLEMMGGEFCGNAARSFGLFVARQTGLPAGTLDIEISGCDAPLCVRVDVARGWARVAMPLPLGVCEVAWRGRAHALVQLPGIWHAVLAGVAPDEQALLRVRDAAYRLGSPDALGVLFLDEPNKAMCPAVYVRDTDTTVWEKSCGSGSVATAIWFSRAGGEGTFAYDIAQPGGSIRAGVCRKNGGVASAWIEGDISLGAPRRVCV